MHALHEVYINDYENERLFTKQILIFLCSFNINIPESL